MQLTAAASWRKETKLLTLVGREVIVMLRTCALNLLLGEKRPLQTFLSVDNYVLVDLIVAFLRFDFPTIHTNAFFLYFLVGVWGGEYGEWIKKNIMNVFRHLNWN